MAYTRGRCTNFDYCILADARRDVEVAVGQDFNCPGCGQPLRAPPLRSDGTGLAVFAMIGLGAFTLLCGALYLGIVLGERAHLIALPTAVPPTLPALPHHAAEITSSATQPRPVVFSASAATVPAARDESVLLRIAGSAEMADRVVPALASSFLAQNGDTGLTSVAGAGGYVKVTGKRVDHDEAILVTASNEAGGFANLAGGSADMVMGARPIRAAERDALTSGETAVSVGEHVVALDAIAVVVNPSMPLNALRLDQLRGVFDGSISDFSALGGASGPIHVYIEAPPSDLRDNFDQMVLAGHAFGPATRLVSGVAELARVVAADSQAIGVVDLPHVGPCKALALADGNAAAPVAPGDAVGVALGRYPLGYKLYFYAPTGSRNSILQHFIAFLGTPEGLQSLASLNLVPPGSMPPSLKPAARAPYDVRRHIGTAQHLDADIHFATNSNTLDPAAQRELDRLADLLLANHITGDRLVLAGFSDDRQRISTSLALSRARADAVAMSLARRGLPPARVDGFGLNFPVAPIATDAGRALNRRVEIYLLP